MQDLAQTWGDDLQIGSTGDLALASAAQLGQQRVLRRLLTNPGDYIWHTEYGAGLARFVGQPASAAGIASVIRGQIFQESFVARTPEPVIDVQSDNAGNLFVHLRYVDADSGSTQVLSFSVTG
jgi:phage baseplate assembly protein W